jgi:flagellar hook-length control protein FliK
MPVAASTAAAAGAGPKAVPVAASRPGEARQDDAPAASLPAAPGSAAPAIMPSKASPAPLAPAADAPAPAATASSVAAAPLASVPSSAVSASPPAPATPPAPAAPPPLASQLATPIVRLREAAPGEHVITVAVTPENLGPVTVRAHVGAAGVRVELLAPTDEARRALSAMLPELRRDLAQGALGTSVQVAAGSAAPVAAGASAGGLGQQGPGQQGPGQPSAQPGQPGSSGVAADLGGSAAGGSSSGARHDAPAPRFAHPDRPEAREPAAAARGIRPATGLDVLA